MLINEFFRLYGGEIKMHKTRDRQTDEGELKKKKVEGRVELDNVR